MTETRKEPVHIETFVVEDGTTFRAEVYQSVLGTHWIDVSMNGKRDNRRTTYAHSIDHAKRQADIAVRKWAREVSKLPTGDVCIVALDRDLARELQKRLGQITLTTDDNMNIVLMTIADALERFGE